MGRRKFAKNSEDVRHFRLVTRSQNDAYADDPDAPPLVLEPCVRPGDQRRTGLSEAELMQIPESLASKHPEAFVDPDAPLRDPNENAPSRVRAGSGESEESDEEDLEGDCYFPKDGYNYDQHLKRVSGTGKEGGGVVGVVLNAPKTAETVPEVQLMKQEATCNEEVEVLRALEMADEYEDMEDGALEELLPGGVMDPTLVLWGPTAAEDTDLPDLAAFKAMHAARMMGGLVEAEEEDDEEGSSDEDDEDGDHPAASSSSRRRRSASGGAGAAEASKSDAAAAAEFEEFFAAEYGEEDDIGACEDEEIEGHMTLENCEEVLDEYLDNKKKEVAKLNSVFEPVKGKLDDVPRVIEETKAIIERHYNEGEESGSDTDSGEESDSESRTWDCESVLSTLSNVSNRPGRIGKIKVIKKPAPAMKAVKEENENDEDSEADDVVELPDVVTERPKNETAEEKKQRKAAVKEMRRICRKMKKESKETYKNETAKLSESKVGNGDIRQKSRTFRL